MGRLLGYPEAGRSCFTHTGTDTYLLTPFPALPCKFTHIPGENTHFPTLCTHSPSLLSLVCVDSQTRLCMCVQVHALRLTATHPHTLICSLVTLTHKHLRADRGPRAHAHLHMRSHSHVHIYRYLKHSYPQALFQAPYVHKLTLSNTTYERGAIFQMRKLRPERLDHLPKVTL